MMQPVELTQVIEALRNACRLRGQRFTEKDIMELGTQLLHDVRQRYNLTADEIGEAIKYGMQGDYGEFTTINYVSAFKWLKTYAMSDERQRRRLKEQQIRNSRTLSEEEIEIYRKKAQRFVNESYLNYKATGKLELTMPEVMIIVTYLQRTGRFPRQIEVTQADYSAARERLKRSDPADIAGMLENTLESKARKCAYERMIKQIFDKE